MQIDRQKVKVKDKDTDRQMEETKQRTSEDRQKQWGPPGAVSENGEDGSMMDRT